MNNSCVLKRYAISINVCNLFHKDFHQVWWNETFSMKILVEGLVRILFYDEIFKQYIQIYITRTDL